MEPACLRHTDLPHTSRLFSDFLYRYHKVERFYTTPPACGYPEERRGAMVEALREQNGGNPSLDRLAQPGAVAVVTGQQVGLFSGPAYTLYKALTAAKMARQMTSEGIAAVPVFWLATEDHDFPEVAQTWIFGAAHEPVRLQIEATRREGQPVGTVAVDKWPLEQLRSSLDSLPFGEEVMALVEASYTSGATLGDAFRQLLQRILEPFGFLFLDPMHNAIRELAAPLLRKAITIGPDLNKALLSRNRELEAAGYHTQVHIDERTSLFFVLEDGRRLPLRDSHISSEELSGRAHQVSPNALLRPVMQDYILPTAAYVGGPAEIAYFAQSQVLYERLLGRMPRVVSRSGFTLFDERAAKSMEKYRLGMVDFYEGEQALHEQIASRLVPVSLETEFQEATAVTEQALDKLGRGLAKVDPTISAALEKSRAKMLYQLAKVRAKAAREAMRRDERARAEAAYLSGSLYPHKHLQERLYSMLPFLAQHGLGLVDKVYENVCLDCPDHILLPVT